jgi:uncharacterized membrane protein
MKSKTVLSFVGIALAGVLSVAQISCTTPEQAATLNNLTLAVNQDLATLENLKTELVKYQAELVAVFNDVKAGKVPYESGLLVAQKVIANIASTQARIVEVQKSYETTKQAIADSKKSGLAWQYYLIPIGTAALGIASMFVPGLSPLVQALSSTKGQLNAVVTGVEQFRKAPDNDPREIDNFIQDAARTLGTENELNKTVKTLTGDTCLPRVLAGPNG